MPHGRWMGTFPIKPAIPLKYLIINALAAGNATFLQNDLGGEQPVTARVTNSYRYWPRRFHQVSMGAPGIRTAD